MRPFFALHLWLQRFDDLSNNGDLFDGQDNPDVRELVERMQKYHDDVEKEFTGQKVWIGIEQRHILCTRL